jgi:hypothetical protein
MLLLQPVGPDGMAAMDWRRAVWRRCRINHVVVAGRQAAEVISLDTVTVRLKEVTGAVVRDANCGLVPRRVLNCEGFSAGVDRRDGHRLGVMLLFSGGAINASHCGNAPVRGVPNTIQIDHLSSPMFVAVGRLPTCTLVCAASRLAFHRGMLSWRRSRTELRKIFFVRPGREASIGSQRDR